MSVAVRGVTVGRNELSQLEILQAIQELEDYAYRPSIKKVISASALAVALVALRDKIKH